MKKPRLLVLLLLILTYATTVFSGQVPSPVTSSHLIMIESLFRDNKLNDAAVGLDRNGRVLLKGKYRDSREVSLAFSLAQSVVGVKWTSPVTPENIKVREWAQNLSNLFPAKKVQEPHARSRRGEGGGHGRLALIVGVSKFKYDLTGKNALKYAADDAAAVKDYLIKYRSYDSADVTLLVNEKATRKNVQQALAQLAEKAEDGDEVFLYFSSHGAPVYDGSLNIVTYDTLFKNHFTMSDSSFPSKSLRTFMEGARSAKVYVVLDVCYSGAAFKGIEGFYYSGSKSITFDDDNQGFSKTAMAKTLLGAKDILLEDQSVKSRVIMSASDAGEKSWESDSIKGSFFTHHLLQELRSGKDIKSAFDGSKPRVTADVKAEKKAEQNPQVISSSKDWGSD